MLTLDIYSVRLAICWVRALMVSDSALLPWDTGPLSLLLEKPFLAMVSKSLKRSSGSLESMSPPHAALINDLCSSNNPQ